MPPSQVSTANTLPPRPPTQAFTQETLDKFHAQLVDDPTAQALTPNERSNLKMILEDGYEVPRKDQLGQEKSKKDWGKENTRLWRAKQRWSLNSQNQVMRKPENDYDERIAACTYDAGHYIVEKHGELGHTGITKTFNSLQEDVYGIRRKDVGWLVNKCAICNFHRANNSKAPLEPIIVERVMERLQIDLIDMRHTPDGHYKWILQNKDHFSKYTCLFALRSKEASEVANALAIFLGCFGPPEIAQMDNGKEFKGVCLLLLKRFGIRIIHGRPRRPQTQGLVEQANGVAKLKLGAYLREMGTTAWAAALPVIATMMNSQPHKSLPRRMTPFQVMFSRRIVGLQRANYHDRLKLFQINDEAIDKYCSPDHNPEESDAVLDELIAQLPDEIDIDDVVDEDDLEFNEATIKKQVKELIGAGFNIDPQLLFVSSPPGTFTHTN